MILPGFPHALPRKSGASVSKFFSALPFTGTGSPQTIVNGLDLSGKGGLVWLKSRASGPHILVDSARGANYLSSNSSLAQAALAGFQLNSDGFYTGTGGQFANGNSGMSWSFIKAPKFFDVVQYTGNGVSGRQITHGLGKAPGMIFVKNIQGSALWVGYHRSVGGSRFLRLDGADAAVSSSALWANTDPTDAVFTVGNHTAVNNNGTSYIAYLFAHDSSPDGLMAFGEYVGTAALPGPTINLGWTPQFVMLKDITLGGSWGVFDSARGMGAGAVERYIDWGSTLAESSASEVITPTPTGFTISTDTPTWNRYISSYVYMAIRAA